MTDVKEEVYKLKFENLERDVIKIDEKLTRLATVADERHSVIQGALESIKASNMEIISKLTTRITTVELRMVSLKEDIDDVKKIADGNTNTFKWLSRMVIGAIIMAILALVLKVQ